MKVIDLLNKIANGEITELHKFKWNEKIWEEYSKFEEINNDKSYQENRENGVTYMRFASVCDARHFNDEVEILDEEDEFIDIEEWKISDYYKCDDYQLIRDNFEIVNKQINDLIKNQKKIIQALKENK